MDLHWLLYAVCLLAAGLASGFIGGLFGVGGGILRIPIFLYIFPIFGVHSNIAMHLAAGTSLALAILSNFISSRAQYKAGNLDFKFLRSWIPPLTVGVIVGLILVRFVPDRWLVGLFVVILVVEIAQMLLTKDAFRLTTKMPGKLIISLIAGLIGTLSPMIGVTGGTFVTPTLTACGYPIHRAIAIGSAGGLVISVLGTIGSIINGIGIHGRPSFSIGYVDLTAVIVMTPAVIITTPLGVRLANKLDKHKLKRIFGIFLILVALDMIRNLFS